MVERAGAPGALDGLVAVELGDGVAPAFCGKWLAAFGAEVIKVEPPAGDWTRHYTPYEPEAPGPEPAPLFAYLNTGKQGMKLDLDLPGDQATLRALIAHADVLVHCLKPARLRSLGLDEDSLGRCYPELVEVALSPFGTDGPYSGYAATAIVLLALGGYQYLTGEPGRAPLALPGFQPEYLTGLYAVVCALAGTIDRRARGRGRRLELSSLEVMASLHQFTISQYLAQGTIRSRHGNRWENLYPITLLPCRDGYLGFAITTQDQWERLCVMMERPDLIEDQRFATSLLRRQHADALDSILIDWLRDQGKMEFFQRAQEEWRLPVGPLYDLGEVLADPQYQARGFWVQVADAAPGVRYPGLPAAMTATPWSIARSPRLGEHNDAITHRLRQPRAREHPGKASTPSQPDGRGARDAAPLAGVRVLDFTRVWSGPLCTRILADLGAEVIKIEAPLPAGAPPAAGNAARAGPGFAKLNRNKLGVAVDLRLPAGRDLVRGLVAKSDVLVENFSVRVMPNFGLSYDDLRAINPRLVMLAMPGFGAVGPYRDYMAYGPAIEPMTGLDSLLGYPGGPPMVSAIAYPDAVAGVTAACAILVALAHQRRTGTGQFIDLSQLEATTDLIGEYLLAYQLTGEPPPRLGNAHPRWAPHGTYPCRGEDAWVSLAVRSDADWENFCRATGRADLGRDPDYAGALGRRRHRDRLDVEITAWTRDRDKFEVMETLQRAGVPAGAVLDAAELLENAQLAHRGFYVEARGRDRESFLMPGTPIVVDGIRRQDWQMAPALGEHNHQVLQDVLGLSADEIAHLGATGVLSGSPQAAGPPGPATD